MTLKLVVCLAFVKKLQALEKSPFSEQKVSLLIWAEKIFKTVCGNLLSFGDFTVPKFALHNKIVNKTQTIKNQENFV